MAQKSTMTFKKGDDLTHYYQMPADSWSAGGTLFFTAKPEVDNDVTDANAVIDKSFDDSDIVDDTHEFYDEDYVTYQLEFAPGDITGVNFTDGEKKKKYLGEFQFVSDAGKVTSDPNDDNFIEVIIYADIKRGVS